MATSQTSVISSADKAIIAVALTLYVKSLLRQQRLHPSGSALYDAIGKDVLAVNNLINSMGAI